MVYIKSRKHPVAAPPRLTGAAVATLATLAWPMAALAQEAAPAPAAAASANANAQQMPVVKVQGAAQGSLKADTVSSPKFTQPLLNTTQTITVIKKEILQQQGATTLAEALRNTPGVTMLLGENGNTATGDSISMRGFDTQGSIFVDGIRDLGFISRDAFNIDQVEVVKGPVGTDNGRGAASGYVNLVSKLPQADEFSNGTAGVNTEGFVRVTADLNRQLEGVLPGTAVRLNVMKQGGDVAGRNFVKKDNWAIAPSLALGLGTPTRAYFYYLHTEQDNRPDGGVTTLGLPGYRLPTVTDSGAPVSLAAPPRVDSSTYYGSLDDFDRVKTDMFTARVEHEFASGVVLRNISRLAHTEQTYAMTGVNQLINSSLALNPLDPSQWTIARTRQGRDQQNEILTNQSNLTAKFDLGGFSHALSTGIEFMHERQASNAITARTATDADATNVYNPDINGPFLPLAPNGAFSNGTTLTAAVYVFDTVKLNEQWQLNGGLRWEKFRTEFASATFTAATSTLTRNAPLSLVDDLTTWKLGALYKPAPNGSIYASASTSMQPPGGANVTLNSSATNINNPNFSPQEANNLELGTKWDLVDGKLALTAALFRSENKNEIVTNAANEALQIGKRRVQGVELGAVGQVSTTWTASAGLALLNAEITNGNAQTTGTVIPFTPEQSLTVWSTYTGLPGWTLGGGGRFYSKMGRSGTATAGVVTEAPGYGLLDAMASYEVNKTLSLQLNVYNVTDKDYVSSVNNSGARYFPGAPRSAMLTALFTY